MPISPMPPSAMNTSSSGRGSIALVGHQPRVLGCGVRQRDVAERELALEAQRVAHDEGAAGVEVEEGAGDALAPRVDGQALANGAAVLEPGRAHGGKAPPAIPNAEPALHGRCEDAEHGFRRHAHAVGGQVGRRAAEARGVRGQIDANADHDHDLLGAAARVAFGQYARTLGLADQDVVGPFQPEAGNPRAAGRRGDGLHHGHAGQQRELMHHRLRAGKPLQQAGVEIAGLGGPVPAGAAAALRLAPRHDPQGPGLAGRRALEGFRIGGAGLLENDAGEGLGRHRRFLAHSSYAVT